MSKINLVDLAGSERISKTMTEGVGQQEALYINKSLTFLEQVVIALGDRKRKHIPYRQSKLTHILSDSIGGRNNTILIANVWGEESQIEETVCNCMAVYLHNKPQYLMPINLSRLRLSEMEHFRKECMKSCRGN